MGNDFVDSGQAGFQGKLLNAREKRKQAEQDAQLLANRIALLKQEEQKAWRKIEQTKTRAQSILELRVENEKRMAHRAEADFAHDRASEKEQRIMNAHKEVARMARQKQYEMEVAKKRDSVEKVKQDKRLARKIKQQRAIEVREHHRENSMQIRRQEALAKERREAEKAELIRRNREAYERRIEGEEKSRRKLLGNVMKMEQRERELIERLRNTQQLQQEAYSQLETALHAQR